MSDDAQGVGNSEGGSIVSISEVPMEKADGFDRGRVEYIHNERVASYSSSTSQPEIGDALANFDVSRRGKGKIRRMEHLGSEYSSYCQGVNDRTDFDLDVDRPEYVNFQDEDTLTNIRIPIESLRSRHTTDKWGVISKGPVPSYRPVRGYSPYHDQGPSTYDLNSYYEQVERARYLNHDLNGPPRVENLEYSRAELRRKIDELKYQLSQSCDVTENPKGRTGTDQKMISPASTDPYARNYAAYVSPYLSQADEFVPYTDKCSSSLKDSYPQTHEFLSYDDTYQQDRFWRLPPGLQPQYTQCPYHEHVHDYYGDANRDLFVLRPDETLFHQSASPCVPSYNKNLYVPPTVDPLGLYNRRSRDELSDLNYRHHLYPIQHGPQSYSSRGFNLYTLHSQQHLTRNPTELDSENDGINHNHPKNVVIPHRNGQVWHPIAGGAPFIACSKCFELLKLPRKHISLAKNQQKLKCGACSSIILFELGNRGSTLPVDVIADHISAETDDGFSVTVDENVSYQDAVSNFADMNASSDDYDDSQPEVFPSVKKSNSGESEKQLDPHSSVLSLTEDEQIPETLASGNHGSPSADLHLKEVENSPHPQWSSEECPDHCSADIVVSRFDKGNKSKRPEFDENTPQQNFVEDSVVATETDMSLNEFTYSGVSQDSLDESKEHYLMANNTPRQNSVEDSVVATETDMSINEFTNSGVSQGFLDGSKGHYPMAKNTPRQNSVEDLAVATETDMSLNEFTNSGISQDSLDESKEHYLMANKGADPFFAGLIKKKFGDFLKSTQNVEDGQSQVFVNGHLIPDHLVKHAEKLAGPIQAGEYWYDVHAGFWGVMGYPCLGIIMPNIEEFNYPMPKNCAAGNTGVFINGRELHQKDFDLLVGRGLPNTRHRSYLIEISGEVVDEDTGEELDGLGRLASTVEKAKRGFGMKVPGFIIRLQCQGREG